MGVGIVEVTRLKAVEAAGADGRMVAETSFARGDWGVRWVWK
jgi:hypothetical protein